MAENRMAEYTKLPIPIKAYQTEKEFNIETLEGTMHASVGDYIITGVNGEQYPCKPDIFKKTYIEVGRNKMEQVAALFGKKLNEEFVVRLGNRRERMAYFSEKGLYVLGTTRFVISDTALKELLVGYAEIVEDEE